jgi:hypothetical protein
MTANQPQAPRQIVLNEEHIKNLEAYISEIPTRLGLPLINFLNALAQEQGNEKNSVEPIDPIVAASMQSSEEV